MENGIGNGKWSTGKRVKMKWENGRTREHFGDLIQEAVACDIIHILIIT